MFKIFQKKCCKVGLCMGSILIWIMILLSATNANADLFYDDFEDGDYAGWTFSNTGGFGDSATSLNGGLSGDPENYVAWVVQIGANESALTQDFEFVSNATLMFDMQTRIIPLGFIADAWSGVTFTFMDSLDQEVGIFSLYCSSISIGRNITDQYWHHYSYSISQLATLAGTNLDDPSKIRISFWAAAQGTTDTSRADVYFDNVQLVPEPTTLSLLALGTMLLTKKR